MYYQTKTLLFKPVLASERRSDFAKRLLKTLKLNFSSYLKTSLAETLWWKSQTRETAATVLHVCPYRRNVMISFWNVLSFSGFCFGGSNVTFLKSKAHSWPFSPSPSFQILPTNQYSHLLPCVFPNLSDTVLMLLVQPSDVRHPNRQL